MNNDKDAIPSYSDLFVRFSAVVERWLKRFLFFFIAALIASQLFMQFAEIRYILSPVERVEGIHYPVHPSN